MSTKEIYRLPTVLHHIGLSKTTLYALVKTGKFMPPIALGPRSVGWLSSDVDTWIEQRVAESRAPNGGRQK